MGIEKILGILLAVIMTIGSAVYYNFGRVESIDASLKSHVKESTAASQESRKLLIDHLIKK